MNQAMEVVHEALMAAYQAASDGSRASRQELRPLARKIEAVMVHDKYTDLCDAKAIDVSTIKQLMSALDVLRKAAEHGRWEESLDTNRRAAGERLRLAVATLDTITRML